MLKKELQEITELLPVPRTDISCLDLVRLESYLRDIINDPEIPSTEEEWAVRLTPAWVF